MHGIVTDLVDLLRRRAGEQGDSPALLFQESGAQPRAVAYGELDAQARAVAVALTGAGAGPGDRALLVHAPGQAYVAGFFGALYAGVVPVPVYPPRDSRGVARVAAITADAGARFALTDASTDTSVRQRLDPALCWLRTDELGDAAAGDWRAPRTDPDAVAFLQYTSGSTATPKGVVVSHANLLHNSEVIARVLGAGPATRAVSWLPPYHDMGLIGGILQPLYSGFPCLLLPPAAFLHEPARWLRAIAAFGATSSAAPDFAYAECVRRVPDAEVADLDLSGWRHALVGAERVRPQTLDAFARKFAPAGFRASAFLPCYGLAEATLFVTGVKRADTPARLLLDRAALARDEVHVVGGGVPYASCGAPVGPAGPDVVAIVDPDTATRRPERRVGEVWISGPTVATGYWGSDTPFGPTLDGRSWLRTGDLGFLDGGELYVTGRLKDLIVVRGTNHYPEDLEATAEGAAEALLPGRSAAFPLDDGTAEDVVVVAEVRRGATLNGVAEAVRAAVSAAHGIALHDVLLVRAGGVPRTSSGKTQRRECARRYRDGTLPVARPPREAAPAPIGPTDVPDGLAAAVAAALDRDPGTVDPTAPLIEQGLDSLRAARLRAFLGERVDLAALLGGATLRDLAELPLAGSGGAAQLPAGDGPIPATPGQERLWLLDGLGAGAAYHVTGIIRLPGGVEESAAVAAVRRLVERHPTLRTAVRIGVDGRLEQVVDEHAAPPVERLATTADVAAWSKRPFDLGTAPLVRAALIAEGPSLALCAHHIAVDGRSLQILAQEFAAACRAFADGRPPDLPPVPATFAAYARRPAAAPDDDFWRSYLDGAEATEASVAPPAVGAAAFAGASVPLELPPELTERLRGLARDTGATVFMVLAAGLATVLARWSNRTDVLFGAAADGRPDTGFDRVVGFFVTTLPLRVDLAADPAFRDLLRQVRDRALAVYPRRDVPAPLIRHLLVLQEPRPTELPVTVPAPTGAKFDLEFEFVPEPDGALRGTLTYATARFEPADARGLATALRLVLSAAADDPGRRVSRLPVLSAPPPGPPPAVSGPGLLEGFHHSVDTHPDHTAVIDPTGTHYTYAQLDRWANRIAHHLLHQGIGPEDIIAVNIPRSAALTATIWAIWKTGAVYLPLDPDYPTHRLHQYTTTTQPKTTITPTLPTTLHHDNPTTPHHRPPTPHTHPDNAAYLIFTSGTTGQPKAAINTHRGLTNRLAWMQHHIPITPHDRILHKTPTGFDVSLWELTWPHLHAATLIHLPPGQHRDPTTIHHTITHHHITICHFVPAMLRTYLNHLNHTQPPPPPHLHHVISSGEPLTTDLTTTFHTHHPTTTLHNMYGPTETAIDVTATPIHPNQPITIGPPTPGNHILILNHHHQPQPPNTPGQLCIAGPQLARGYHHQPGHTADTFRPHPTQPGQRTYTTGDTAHQTHTGTLHYHGRTDHQTKIRGMRIEPTEITHQLTAEPTVAAAHVTVHPDRDGQPQLVAYLQPAAGAPAEPGEHAALVRESLRRRVPEAMVPARFIVLDAWPVTANGKLDTHALPDPSTVDVRTQVGRPFVEPRTPAERSLAAVWQALLDVDRVGADDDFFDLGGHSLLATRLAARLRSDLGVDVALAELFAAPTLAAMALLVEQAQRAAPAPLAPIRRADRSRYTLNPERSTPDG